MKPVRSYCSIGIRLPSIVGGSAPASPVSGPAQRSQLLRPADLPSRHGDPLHQRLQQLRCLCCCSDCYRVERTSSRAGLAPTVDQRLFTAHDELGLVRTLPAATPFFRVRAHPRAEVCNNWQNLGSPPPEKSVTSRMSPAGISMFYAALDMATAKAEITISLPPKDVKVLTGAKWVSTRAFNVLDLAALPEPPSFYARVRYDRERLLFLKKFVDSITEPVAHDGKEHIDYVPTQILTEYFRYRYRANDKSRLGGIIYPSAQRKHGRSIVIFASHGDLDPNHSASHDGMPPLLALDSSSVKRLRRLRGTKSGAVL
jgi:hypothetical protein